mmetsp:Transcript_5696/g.15142  ORF Transcript_5696/g.15142 Transcript_5696/m.15142 type:complete len:257 (+) Transcript_5696:610-1380(+)
MGRAPDSARLQPQHGDVSRLRPRPRGEAQGSGDAAGKDVPLLPAADVSAAAARFHPLFRLRWPHLSLRPKLASLSTDWQPGAVCLQVHVWQRAFDMLILLPRGSRKAVPGHGDAGATHRLPCVHRQPLRHALLRLHPQVAVHLLHARDHPIWCADLVHALIRALRPTVLQEMPRAHDELTSAHAWPWPYARTGLYLIEGGEEQQGCNKAVHAAVTLGTGATRPPTIAYQPTPVTSTIAAGRCAACLDACGMQLCSL